MRYYLPDIHLAKELPEQKEFQDKLGGIPWGLSEKQWPKCKECQQSQSLLAQFAHHPERMDLGKEGRVLHVFMCNNDPGACSSWETDSGANSCFVTDSEEMQNCLSEIPADNPPIEKEARILAWLEKEDGITDKEKKAFYNDKYFELEENTTGKVSPLTRLGSVPFWIQSPEEAPSKATFIGQLSSEYSFFTSPKNLSNDLKKEIQQQPETVKKRSLLARIVFFFLGISSAPKIAVPQKSYYDPNAIHQDLEKTEGRSHYTSGPNFGDAGMGYIFIRNTKSKPKGYFFWQCS